MKVLPVLALALAVAGIAGGAWYYLHSTDQLDDLVDDVSDFVVDSADRMRVPAQKALGHTPHASKVIYLNREGGTFAAGQDDARKNLSSILRLRGLSQHSVDAFSGSQKSFEAIASCVAENFDAYDVKVVTSRPVNEEYLMVMVGGRPGDLKDKVEHKGVHLYGLAPSAEGPVERAVVYVFAREMGNSVKRVCETASHEVAHAYGLDHTRECSDLMSYKKPCRTRRVFADKPAECGENKTRQCDRGGTTQNSHSVLLGVLGARP